MTYLRVAWTPVLTLVLLGCSIPMGGVAGSDRELLLGYAATNPSQGQIHRIVLGLDLGIDVPARGLVLGISDLRVLTPIGAAPDLAPAAPIGCNFLLPLGIGCGTSQGTTRRLGLVLVSYPLEELHARSIGFLHYRALGFSIRAGALIQGVSTGFDQATALWGPQDRPVRVTLDYRSRDIEGSSLIYREGMNPQ